MRWPAAAPELILEPLAEPRQALDNIWNKTAAELIAAVREHDQQRTILLGPRTMNNARFLGELSLPHDEHNLIVGIHHYWPITFTMQGEMWLGKDHIFGNPHDWLGTTWDQTPAQEAELRTGFAQVAGWAGDRPADCSSASSALRITLTSPAASGGPASTADSPKNTASPGASGPSRQYSPSTTSKPARSTRTSWQRSSTSRLCHQERAGTWTRTHWTCRRGHDVLL